MLIFTFAHLNFLVVVLLVCDDLEAVAASVFDELITVFITNPFKS